LTEITESKAQAAPKSAKKLQKPAKIQKASLLSAFFTSLIRLNFLLEILHTPLSKRQ